MVIKVIVKPHDKSATITKTVTRPSRNGIDGATWDEKLTFDYSLAETKKKETAKKFAELIEKLYREDNMRAKTKYGDLSSTVEVTFTN